MINISRRRFKMSNNENQRFKFSLFKFDHKRLRLTFSSYQFSCMSLLKLNVSVETLKPDIKLCSHNVIKSGNNGSLFQYQTNKSCIIL